MQRKRILFWIHWGKMAKSEEKWFISKSEKNVIHILPIPKWISPQSICHKSLRLSLDSQHQSGHGSTLVSLALCKQRQEDPWDSLAINYCRVSELQAQWETSPLKMWRTIKEDTQHQKQQPLTSYAYTYVWAHLYTHMHTQIHTHKLYIYKISSFRLK